MCMQKFFLLLLLRWWSGKEFKNVTTLNNPCVFEYEWVIHSTNICIWKVMYIVYDTNPQWKERKIFLFLIFFYATLVFNSDKFKINAFVCVLLDDHWKMCFWLSFILYMGIVVVAWHNSNIMRRKQI